MNERAVRRLLIATSLLALMILGAYVLNFTVRHETVVSADPAAWGQFGDYVGGLLNPIFGFLAFLGVLWTLHLQTVQLTITKRQAEVEELQRLLSSVSKEADQLLNHKPKRLEEGVENEHLTVFQIVAGIGTAYLGNSPKAQEIRNRSFQAIQFSITALAVELSQLVLALKEYVRLGGSPTIVAFYKRRYEVVLSWLDVSGMLGPNDALREYFETARVATKLRETP
jgi:uncharacterized protein YoxC